MPAGRSSLLAKLASASAHRGWFADQRGDDLAERGADDDADRQIDHVALHGKFFELTGDTHGFTTPFGVSLSTACGSTWESFCARSCGLMPNFAASPEITSEPNTACT